MYFLSFLLKIIYITVCFYCSGGKLEGPLTFLKPEEGCGNNRSVMPLDVPGCTRATMIIAVSILPSSCAQLFSLPSSMVALYVSFFGYVYCFRAGNSLMHLLLHFS